MSNLSPIGISKIESGKSTIGKDSLFSPKSPESPASAIPLSPIVKRVLGIGMDAKSRTEAARKEEFKPTDSFTKLAVKAVGEGISKDPNCPYAASEMGEVESNGPKKFFVSGYRDPLQSESEKKPFKGIVAAILQDALLRIFKEWVNKQEKKGNQSLVGLTNNANTLKKLAVSEDKLFEDLESNQPMDSSRKAIIDALICNHYDNATAHDQDNTGENTKKEKIFLQKLAHVFVGKDGNIVGKDTELEQKAICKTIFDQIGAINEELLLKLAIIAGLTDDSNNDLYHRESAFQSYFFREILNCFLDRAKIQDLFAQLIKNYTSATAKAKTEIQKLMNSKLAPTWVDKNEAIYETIFDANSDQLQDDAKTTMGLAETYLKENNVDKMYQLLQENGVNLQVRLDKDNLRKHYKKIKNELIRVLTDNFVCLHSVRHQFTSGKSFEAILNRMTTTKTIDPLTDEEIGFFKDMVHFFIFYDHSKSQLQNAIHAYLSYLSSRYTVAASSESFAELIRENKKVPAILDKLEEMELVKHPNNKDGIRKKLYQIYLLGISNNLLNLVNQFNPKEPSFSPEEMRDFQRNLTAVTAMLKNILFSSNLRSSVLRSSLSKLCEEKPEEATSSPEEEDTSPEEATSSPEGDTLPEGDLLK